MAVSMLNLLEMSNATIGSPKMDSVWCAFGTTTCFKIWRES
jgi:hypothetical protein